MCLTGVLVQLVQKAKNVASDVRGRLPDVDIPNDADLKVGSPKLLGC